MWHDDPLSSHWYKHDEIILFPNKTQISHRSDHTNRSADRTFVVLAGKSLEFFFCLCVGRNVLTNFHGMDLTTDKLRSMVKKWQTLIEASADVKTSDGYLLRVFCIGFTNKDQLSQRKTCYAQHTQVRWMVLWLWCLLI